jgi:hypothetical protein
MALLLMLHPQIGCCKTDALEGFFNESCSSINIMSLTQPHHHAFQHTLGALR